MIVKTNVIYEDTPCILVTLTKHIAREIIAHENNISSDGIPKIAPSDDEHNLHKEEWSWVDVPGQGHLCYLLIPREEDK